MDDAVGYQLLLDLLAEYGDTEDDAIPVAIETSRGLLVAALRQGRRQVFSINPMAAACYRDRHGVSRKKSDPGDALVLANILRTDMPMHRPLPDDTEPFQLELQNVRLNVCDLQEWQPPVTRSVGELKRLTDLARAIAVLARAQQDATWNRQQISKQLRSLLREYYPAALEAFATWQNGLCRPEARELLKVAPTTAKAARLTRMQITAALKRVGRQRGIEAEAERLREIFRADWAHQPQLVEDALGRQMLALLRQLEAVCIAADELTEAAEASFRQHPDAEILLSFPGIGPQTGARVLAEVGDDRSRFADARSLKAYAGSAPITRASGKKHHAGRRVIKNNRLHHAGYLWAFSSITASPGANSHYRHRREVGDWHAQAQRHLFNRMLGQLFHCLKHRTLFDEHQAFPSTLAAAA